MRASYLETLNAGPKSELDRCLVIETSVSPRARRHNLVFSAASWRVLPRDRRQGCCLGISPAAAAAAWQRNGAEGTTRL